MGRGAEFLRRDPASEGPAGRDRDLAEVYRELVQPLTEVLAVDDALQARELVPGLVEEIRLVPDGGRRWLDVRGKLGQSLRLAKGLRVPGCVEARNAKSPARLAEALVMQNRL